MDKNYNFKINFIHITVTRNNMHPLSLISFCFDFFLFDKKAMTYDPQREPEQPALHICRIVEEQPH